ncbi:hypothetical protein HED60_12715 [Planctomycetales bacterium ZRK34]|nr:hypothetical protein HED60_12715 [Planctomycetales bacterium ZRK34]
MKFARQFGILALVGCFLVGCDTTGDRAAVNTSPAVDGNWYQRSMLWLHEDHHTQAAHAVGREADPAETRRLIAELAPDVLQIHAKGNPGWTTYPSKVGYTPPKLARDVLGLYRDIARQDGYHWSIYYNIGRDGEIMRRRPEFNRDRPDGSEYERALCYHSGVGPQYIWPMLREIITGYQPDGFWFDGSVFTIANCYCPVCRERFQREQQLDAPKRPGDKGWSAYSQMQRQIYREFITQTCQQIHAVDPDCLVSFNWAYSIRMPERPDPAIAYLTGDIANHVEKLPAEAHWYDSTGLPFDLMTTGHTFTQNDAGKLAAIPKPAAQIQQEIAVIIANGGRFNLWDNPTPESGLRPERFEAFNQYVTPFVRARQPWCMNTQRTAEVSLLHNTASHYALAEKTRKPFNRANNRIDGATEMLSRLHLDYEMIGDWRLHALDVRSPLLVVEHPRALSAADIDAIKKLIASGRDVLITGMGLNANKKLWPVFGIASIDFASGSEPFTVTVDNRKYELNHWLNRITVAGADVLLTAVDADGKFTPLLTAHRHGRCTAYYMPIPLLSAHQTNTPPIGFVNDVFAMLRPMRERVLATDAPPSVHVILRQRGEQRIVHMVNMSKGHRIITSRKGTYDAAVIDRLEPVPPCHVSLQLDHKPRAVTLQPQNQPVTGWRYANGRLEVDSPSFDVHQMIVID